MAYDLRNYTTYMIYYYYTYIRCVYIYIVIYPGQFLLCQHSCRMQQNPHESVLVMQHRWGFNCYSRFDMIENGGTLWDGTPLFIGYTAIFL